MKPEKVNIILPENYKGEPVELVFREGEAEPIRDDHKKVAILVAISSLHAYVDGKIFADDPKLNPGILLYNYDSREVEFLVNPNDVRADILRSKLIIHPDLAAFGINEEKQFTSRQLIKHVTKYAHCLADIDAPRKLVKSLQNHDVKFEQQMKSLDDRQGNTEKSVKTALKFVEGELDPNWKLSVPLFKGEPAVDLDIEIQIDAVNGQPVYSFWCLELESLIQHHAIATIDMVVGKFRNQFTTMQII